MFCLGAPSTNCLELGARFSTNALSPSCHRAPSWSDLAKGVFHCYGFQARPLTRQAPRAALFFAVALSTLLSSPTLWGVAEVCPFETIYTEQPVSEEGILRKGKFALAEIK